MGGLRYESMADMPPGLREKYAAQQVAGKVLAKPAQAAPVAGPAEKESNKDGCEWDPLRLKEGSAAVSPADGCTQGGRDF